MGNLRLGTVFIGLAVITGAIFGGVATMYLLGGLLDSKLFVGAHHLLNIVILMLTFVMIIATFLTLAERKWSALMQDRIGPNRAGIPQWGILLQPLGFIIFFAAAFAETKRAPFDVPEGESEIIGYFVEYSGMKFGLFMIAEFVEVVVLSGVLIAIFFGGPYLPFGNEAMHRFFASQQIGGQSLEWLYGSILGTVFWIKVILLCYLQLAIRWTFPRFRYDQIQSLGWKILLPVGLVNVFLSGALILWDPSLHALAIMGVIEIGILIAMTLTPAPAKSRADAHIGHHGPAGDHHALPAGHH
jgi:NADH-quinone oxidoreductase subunit H